MSSKIHLNHFFFPPRCLLCHLTTKKDESICSNCFEHLPKSTCRCFICGIILNKNEHSCIQCQITPPPFDRTIALFDYKPPISTLIKSFKFHQQLAIRKFFAEAWIDVLNTNTNDIPSLIIPVPLHTKRLKQRGYNQIVEIVKPIARHFKIPISKNDIIRIKNTEPQSSLSQYEKTNNLVNAFKVTHQNLPKQVALFDDVMTSGATMTALSHCLKKSGVEKISVYCCARA